MFKILFDNEIIFIYFKYFLFKNILKYFKKNLFFILSHQNDLKLSTKLI
jgi:hypothetical protein